MLSTNSKGSIKRKELERERKKTLSNEEETVKPA